MNQFSVTGSLTTGEQFRGVDSVRVIDPGNGLPAFSVSGVYFVRIETVEGIQTGRALLMK